MIKKIFGLSYLFALFAFSCLANNYEAINTIPLSSATSYSMLFDLAKTYDNQKNWAQALQYYLAASDLEPLLVEPLLEIAQHYNDLNQHSLCYLFAHRAAELSPTNNDIINNLLSFCAWHVGDYECGYEATRNILKTDHNNDQFLENLALYIQKKEKKSQRSTLILNIMPTYNGIGGLETHLLTFNKLFAERGIQSRILTNGSLVTKLTNQEGFPYGLPSIGYDHSAFSAYAEDVIEQNPAIVICNNIDEIVIAVLKAKQFLPIKIVYVHHESNDDELFKKISILSKCDGVIIINPKIVKKIQSVAVEKGITLPLIESIPPFFDNTKFLSFIPRRTKKDFFVEEFGINITDDLPNIAVIANMVENKNHSLLFKALDILYNQRNKKFHVYLAGSGHMLEKNKQIIQEMNLNENVNFVGETLNTPELLYHTNIHILPSKFESFGIAHMEAALMKKPFIGDSSTAISIYIEEGINGFTFENNNAQDLANKLEYLLDNPNYCKTMGENAYHYVLKNFTPEVTFDKWKKFLDKI